MYSYNLIKELTKLANQFGGAKVDNITYTHTIATSKNAVIFKKVELNFFDESWNLISKNPQYFNRTKKIHSHFDSIIPLVYEMQSSNSSDALAMNIFCHPKIKEWKGIRNLFQLPIISTIEFGFKPQIIKIVNGNTICDSTEVDVFINNSIIGECKLTEEDFTSKSKKEVEQYKEFKNVFHIDKLIQNETKYHNYQLIRNILAANQHDCHFILFCDIRRPDLAKSFYQTIRCIKDDYINLRTRCEIIYWQDIAQVVGQDLKKFLNEKYGL